jgi:hypothetical protein
MAQLSIPDEYVAGLAHFITLPDEAIHELALALSESPASLDVKNSNAVTSLVSAKAPTIPTKTLRRVMAALLSLYTVRAASETPTDEFLDDVVRAMKRSRRPELSLDDTNADRFRNRLKTLLSLSTLTTASKAVVLQHEHEHTLCTARIFTDARPAYGEDVASPPSAVAIMHMLKLTYHEGNRTEEIHIAFDKADLLTLKSLIARAESKAVGLRKVFESAHIPVIE